MDTMADYFLVHDAAIFEERLRPALARSWHTRNFEPCRSLCAEMLAAAQTYKDRYHLGDATSFVAQVAAGLPFDRDWWRMLAGELLLFTAVEIPEFQTSADTLCCLLAPDYDPASNQTPELLPAILQAHRGSRDLMFGTTVYRPDRAGLNTRSDVRRLADWLETVDPLVWNSAPLVNVEDMDEDDRAEELEFVREWFPVLVELYRRVRDRGQLLIHESIP
jgi:hypothetical protein